jgi:glycerophosphoryl diester phosphodiesterase
MSLQGRLLDAPIAHRGLWRGAAAPENSLAAFEAACAAGYGIELDVRLSADGEAVVFHDETLDRMTAQSGLVEERTAEALTGLTLLGSSEAIPTLQQTLALVGTRAVMLVELKTPAGQDGPLEARTAELLAAHPGPVGVLSFNPDSLAWFADHAPPFARLLNIRDEADLAGMDRARPHILSASLQMVDHPRVQDWHNAGRALICWTVRSPSQADPLMGQVDNLIFEGYAP